MPFEPFFDKLVDAYLANDGFGHHITQPTDECLWKLSSDNRRIWGDKNQVWTLSPLSVARIHSPKHTYSIMVASIHERNLPFTSCVVDSKLDEFLGDFNSQSFWRDGEEIFHHLQTSCNKLC